MRLFNRKNEEIEELKEKVASLEEAYETLKQDNEELKEKVSKLVGLYEPIYSSINKTAQRGKDKKQRKKKAGSDDITKYAKFDSYKKTRFYNKREDYFYTIGGKNSERRMNLTFVQLIKIIMAYHNNMTAKEMSTQRMLRNLTVQAIQYYIYIYRAGGFNDAIKTYAPKFQQNPDMLISREWE